MSTRESEEAGTTTDVTLRGDDPSPTTVNGRLPQLGAGDEGAGDGPADGPAVATTGDEARARRRWLPWLAAGLVAAGAAGAAVVAVRDGDEVDADTTSVQLTGVRAEQRDLVAYSEVDGTARRGSSRSVTAPSDGTITWVADDGDVVAGGDVVVEVDGEPVVALVGDALVLRTLSEGASGDDVRMLEENLAALGHHEDLVDDEDEPLTLTVDGDFDAATTAALRAFRAEVGLAEADTLAPDEVVAIEGPSVVGAVTVDVADRVQRGGSVAELSLLRATRSVHTATAGDLGLVATAAVPLASGDVLFTVDDRAVVAVVTDVAWDRTLEVGDEGDDVEALEELLAALGHDADGDLEVDGDFDADTRDAVREWEEALAEEHDGTGVDGIVQLTDLVVVPPGDGVIAFAAEEGDDLEVSDVVVTVGDLVERRVVDAAIDPADQAALVEGGTVEVELPDGTVVDGVVTHVATSTTTDPADPAADPTLAVEVELPAVPEAVATLTSFEVTVRLADEVAAGVVAVPVSALVFTGDGYAVEVPTAAGGTTFVGVEPGLFADGFVEVTGIEVGTTVVVPS